MITRSVLFILKCTRNRLAAGLCPDPLGSLSAPPDPLAVLGGWGPPGREGMGREGRGEVGLGRGKGIGWEVGRGKGGEKGGRGREGWVGGRPPL